MKISIEIQHEGKEAGLNRQLNWLWLDVLVYKWLTKSMKRSSDFSPTAEGEEVK